MLQRTLHKLEILDDAPLVIFENHDEDESGKMQHILVWFIKYQDKFYGDFIPVAEKDKIPEYVELLTKQATESLAAIKNK
jgi:hypothetical protein